MEENQLEELVSAYYDGELSEAERALVEARLEESEDFRRQTEDYALLSETLKSLPAAEPPAELRLAILHRIERESLLNAQSVVPQRRWRREWTIVPTAVAVTAAGMLAILWPQWQTPPATGSHEMATARPAAVRIASEVSDSTGEVEPSSWRYDSDEDRRRSDEVAMSGENRDFVTPALREPFRGRSLAGDELAEDEAIRLDVEAQESDLDGVALGLMSQIEEGLAREHNWSGVRIGDVVPYFVEDRDSVAVVELTVVDVIEAAGETEVLLAKNGISPLSDERSLAEANRRGGEARFESAGTGNALAQRLGEQISSSDLLCVYVEGSPEQVATALNELQQQEFVVSTSLQPPIRVSTEGLEAANQLGDAVLSGNGLVESATEQYVAAALSARQLGWNARRGREDSSPDAAGRPRGSAVAAAAPEADSSPAEPESLQQPEAPPSQTTTMANSARFSNSGATQERKPLRRAFKGYQNTLNLTAPAKPDEPAASHGVAGAPSPPSADRESKMAQGPSSLAPPQLFWQGRLTGNSPFARLNRLPPDDAVRLVILVQKQPGTPPAAAPPNP